eukprot:gene8014-8212_t
MERLGYKLIPVPVKTVVNVTRSSSSNRRHWTQLEAAVHSAGSRSSVPIDQLPLLTGFALLSPALMPAPPSFDGLAWPDGSIEALQPLQLMAFDIWLPPNVTALALLALPIYETVLGVDDFSPNAAIISSLYVSYSKPARPPQLVPGTDISYLQNLLGFPTRPVPADWGWLLGTATSALQSEVGPIAFSSDVTVTTLPPGLSWPDQTAGMLLVSQSALTAGKTSESLDKGQHVTGMSEYSVTLSLPPNVTAIGLYAAPVGACNSSNTRITASVFLNSNPNISTSAASDLYNANGLCSVLTAAEAGLQRTRLLAFYVDNLAPGIPVPGSNSSMAPNEERLAKLEVRLVSDLADVSMALSFVQMTAAIPALGPLTRLDPPTGTGSRLEVFAANSWSSVCQRRGMDDTTATVICRQFNFTFGRPSSWVNEGPSGLPVSLADVACKGEEAVLQDCSWQAPSKKICSHAFDATVDCSSGGCQLPIMHTSAGAFKIVVGTR